MLYSIVYTSNVMAFEKRRTARLLFGITFGGSRFACVGNSYGVVLSYEGLRAMALEMECLLFACNGLGKLI